MIARQLDLFHFDKEDFESYSRENGFVCGYASDLSNMLGYFNLKTFEKTQ